MRCGVGEPAGAAGCGRNWACVAVRGWQQLAPAVEGCRCRCGGDLQRRGGVPAASGAWRAL